MSRFAILLADTVAEKKTKYLYLVHGATKTSSVSKGELLVAVESSGYAGFSKLEHYHLATDETTIVNAEADVTAFLTDHEFALLEAIESPLTRYGVYRSGKCSWGSGLKLNDPVDVTIFPAGVTPATVQASAIIRYIGKIIGRHGTMYGVEIVVRLLLLILLYVHTCNTLDSLVCSKWLI